MILQARTTHLLELQKTGRSDIRVFLEARKHLLKGRVLDFGCGTVHRYKDLVDGEWVGFDPGYNAGLARPRNGPYDVILITQVLQFVDDPRATLAMLDGFLKPGGHWVITYSAGWYECQPEDTWRISKLGMERIFPPAEIIEHEANTTLQFGDGFKLNLLYALVARKPQA